MLCRLLLFLPRGIGRAHSLSPSPRSRLHCLTLGGIVSPLHDWQWMQAGAEGGGIDNG